MTMVSWLIDTSLPRIEAGAISAMYIGDRFEARPIPTPPASRLSTKSVNDPARAVPMTKHEYQTRQDQQPFAAEPVGQRPERIAPPRQPIKALLIAQPTSSGVVK